MEENKVCVITPIANMMLSPNHDSELHAQWYFNDLFKLSGQSKGNWVLVHSVGTNDQGWILRSQLESLNTSSPSLDVVQQNINSGLLPDGVVFIMSGKKHILLEQKLYPIDKGRWTTIDVRDILKTILDVPYMWGGMTKYGIDCSGLSRFLYRFAGIYLPHNAAEQSTMGQLVDFLQEVQVGDLAFFEDEFHAITHVGVMLSPNSIIHASEKSGRVVVNHMDMSGIIDSQGRRSHSLRFIKRILST